MGFIKPMLETIENKLKDEQEKESKAVVGFDEMRTDSPIEAAEKMEEEKEAEKADM